MFSLLTSLSIALLGATLSGPAADPPPPSAATVPADRSPAGSALIDAPETERDCIERLRTSSSWVRRALACERLARFDCAASESILRSLLSDRAWQVRCYALVACARRGLDVDSDSFASEAEPRVIRTALRCRYSVPDEMLARGIERLTKSPNLADRLLGIELALAAGVPKDVCDVEEIFRTIILRMDRTETGALSPRLAAISGGGDSGRSYLWRRWYRSHRNSLGLHGAFAVPPAGERAAPTAIAAASSERFVELEGHMRDLSTRALDLAICLDCTASMSGEIAESQAGIDALMLFAMDVTNGVRIGIVGYRDRSADWETKAWDLTPSLDLARQRLWDLSAEGGGDRPEAVFPALRLAYGKLSWAPNRAKALVLVGDAPPHPGTGEHCVHAAKAARAAGVTTYAIAPHAELRPGDRPSEEPDDEAEPDDPSRHRPGFALRRDEKRSPWRKDLKPGEVEYFEEIAEAGGGRAVTLPCDSSLIAEIAGLTLGDSFRLEFDGFFADWLALCR